MVGWMHMDRFITTAKQAVQKIRTEIRWKPNKDTQHLLKRIDKGHLSPGATMADYEAIISTVVSTPSAVVYVYDWHGTLYPTVVAYIEGRRWLVMFTEEGLMETAFPPTEPDDYLADPRFVRLGVLQELEL